MQGEGETSSVGHSSFHRRELQRDINPLARPDNGIPDNYSRRLFPPVSHIAISQPTVAQVDEEARRRWRGRTS